MNETKRTIKLECTRSLRPKEYHRETIIGTIQKNENERFLEAAVSTLKKGTFTDIHTRCQLQHYER